jgi:hypothetical protein
MVLQAAGRQPRRQGPPTRLPSGQPGGLLAEAEMPDVSLLLADVSTLLSRAWYGFAARVRSRDKARDLAGVCVFFALLRVAVRSEIAASPEVVVVFDAELAARRATQSTLPTRPTARTAGLRRRRSRRFPTSSAALTPRRFAGLK